MVEDPNNKKGTVIYKYGGGGAINQCLSCLVECLILFMERADVAPQRGLALADLVAGRIAASVLHLNVNGLHVVFQVVLFVKGFPAVNTGKLPIAAGQDLDGHVGVQQSCKKYMQLGVCLSARRCSGGETGAAKWSLYTSERVRRGTRPNAPLEGGTISRCLREVLGERMHLAGNK